MSLANTLRVPWLALLGAGVLTGLYTAAQLFSEGHALFKANDVIVWTLPLVAYVFFALTSTGLALVASMPLVFGVKELMPQAKRLTFLAIATLAAAFIAIGLELGSLGHMYQLLLSPNLSSPIWYMGALYSLELVLLIIKFAQMRTKGTADGSGKLLSLLSMFCSLFAALMLGAVFGLTEARPTYFGPFISVLFLSLAFMGGVSAILFHQSILQSISSGRPSAAVTSSMNYLGRLLYLSSGAALLLLVLKILLESAATVPALTNSIGIGSAIWLAVPFALMAESNLRQTSWARIFAPATALAGAFSILFQVILSGQLQPVGPKGEGLPALLSYTPNLWELLVVDFAVCVMLLLYTWGESKLRLDNAS
ncbi:polysulfide reductase NrfD [Desulfovibrio mangrovi]|uniref:NrfD/PsrC family molybdoenzyme membrane anchor subunit n=1 Tax=Desulfovibrio mangrovi TaxID=2976983 RepID=UPI00224507FB|nr:NrfD/PsrC family molybdoenzyme membrane anchor subunit [Desulfovibrio mangrovi]UZP68079.1 polysulfide reductase NrfD [Desulfovibrio mangrovi]